MSNPIVHFELWSNDPKAATEFYSQVFGWKINYTPELTYWLVDTKGDSSEGINGGMFNSAEAQLPAKLAFYIQVEDISESLEAAKAKGATLLIGPNEIPGTGHTAILVDPEERAFGLFQPASA
jgi:predicted enzyme related to lactoylglutathione lyase